MIAYLGLGSNLGNRWEQLERAIELLRHTDGLDIIKRSSVYQTKPVGYLDQPDFYNLVVEIKTTLDPEMLLSCILKIEKKMDRVRMVRWGPRTIDIDILLYEEHMIIQENLQIPHPNMFDRGFVLIPLFEVCGDIRLPGKNKTITQLIQTLPSEQEYKIISNS